MSTALSIAAANRVVPPTPEPLPEGSSPFRLAAAMRANGLSSFSRRAFEEEIVQRSLFTRTSILLNDPDAIRHVLVDHHENYGRSPATLRILGPVLGEGLFISQGQAWRHQRRTLAPAFTPKAVDLLVPHLQSAAHDAISDLRVVAECGPVDLLTTLQR